MAEGFFFFFFVRFQLLFGVKSICILEEIRAVVRGEISPCFGRGQAAVQGEISPYFGKDLSCCSG